MKIFFCNVGNLHDLAVELEGMGGGGKIHLEVNVFLL